MRIDMRIVESCGKEKGDFCLSQSHHNFDLPTIKLLQSNSNFLQCFLKPLMRMDNLIIKLTSMRNNDDTTIKNNLSINKLCEELI